MTFPSRWGLPIATVALFAGCNQSSLSIGSVDDSITPSPGVLDFGTVTPGATVTRTVTLLSTSGGDVRVRSIELAPITGGNFTTSAEAGFSVAQGGEVPIEVTFTPTAPGYHTAHLDFLTNGDPEIVSVDLRAYTGTPSLDVYPAILDFGSVGPGETQSAWLSLDNDGSLPVRVESLAFTGPFAAVTPLPFDAPAGFVSRLELAFQPDDALAAEGTVTLTTSTGDLAPIGLRGNACESGDPAAYDRDRDGVTSCGGDCDDDRASAYPGAFELPNGLDDDCNGKVDDRTAAGDDDGDGRSETEGDCDDLDATAYPGAAEAADGVDNDCDGTIDEGTRNGDDDGDGTSEAGGDCDDTDPAIGPHAREIPDNAIDEDCDPSTY